MTFLMVLLAWAQTEPPGVTYIDMGNTEPEHGIVWVILSTFALIAVGLLVTLGLGAGVGALRIWIFKHFPGNTLNGPDHEVMTRLHLDDRIRPDSS